MHDIVKEVLSNTGQFTDEELYAINTGVIGQLKFNRDRKAAANKVMFTVGDRVKFRGRTGDEVGTIVRIKTKKAIINTGPSSRNWDVPLGILKKV